MKKAYIHPAMSVDKFMQLPLLLSGSTPKLGDDYSGEEVLSREFYDFEDFDD